MGRVRAEMEIDGRTCWALFDAGAKNTYIVASAVQDLPAWSLPKPERTGLGGRSYKVTRECMLIGKVEGRWVRTRARIIDQLGKDEDGRPIEILFGALAMQEWGVRPVPDEEKLDMSHYSNVFVEF